MGAYLRGACLLISLNVNLGMGLICWGWAYLRNSKVFIFVSDSSLFNVKDLETYYHYGLG